MAPQTADASSVSEAQQNGLAPPGT